MRVSGGVSPAALLEAARRHGGGCWQAEWRGARAHKDAVRRDKRLLEDFWRGALAGAAVGAVATAALAVGARAVLGARGAGLGGVR